VICYINVSSEAGLAVGFQVPVSTLYKQVWLKFHELFISLFLKYIMCLCIGLNDTNWYDYLGFRNSFCWLWISSNFLFRFSIIFLLCLHSMSFSCNMKLQSNLYIKDTDRNLKMCHLWAVAFYIQVWIICPIHYMEKWNFP
jgi:hypothetical protein